MPDIYARCPDLYVGRLDLYVGCLDLYLGVWTYILDATLTFWGAALRYLLTRTYDYLNTPKSAVIKIKNPISSDLNVMRPSNVPNLLHAINLNNG